MPAIIDAAGRLHVFINERQGQFRERSLPANLATITAIAVADANNDGALDLLAIQADGAVVRISDKNEGQGWNVAEIARVPDAASYPRGRSAPARRRPRQQRSERSLSVPGRTGAAKSHAGASDLARQ